MDNLHLIYHELRPAPSRYTYVAPCAEFEQHCEYFSQLRLDRSPGVLQPQITFDDGHASGREFALPLLERFGLKATFFITAGWTGTRAGYMGGAELRELQSAGMDVGAHGWSHKLLTACSSAELDRELRGAREHLEELLGSPVTTVSLPGGRKNARVLQACRNAGYQTVYTSTPEAQLEGSQTQVIGRYNVRGGTSAQTLAELLHTSSGVLRQQQRADRLKTAAKALFGDRMYASVWGMVNRHESDVSDVGGSLR